jgi:hypothetical protein
MLKPLPRTGVVKPLQRFANPSQLGHELRRRREAPGVDQAILQLLQVDCVEADEDPLPQEVRSSLSGSFAASSRTDSHVATARG